MDGSRFEEFKERYATTLVTGVRAPARLPGGIIANNGVLFSESALKATHFIELCNRAANSADFSAEHHRLHRRDVSTSAAGIAKDGAKMVHAVANTVVPKFTVIIGGLVRRRQLRHVRPRL